MRNQVESLCRHQPTAHSQRNRPGYDLFATTQQLSHTSHSKQAEAHTQHQHRAIMTRVPNTPLPTRAQATARPHPHLAVTVYGSARRPPVLRIQPREPEPRLILHAASSSSKIAYAAAGFIAHRKPPAAPHQRSDTSAPQTPPTPRRPTRRRGGRRSPTAPSLATAARCARALRRTQVRPSRAQSLASSRTICS